ncbi:NAD dependent epimerase/dehydratase [Colletotrichum scovillei]|uniref:NAD dependent epimerase/dehydratase n=1 Tax=Colletotrichum scovillei TaxID=1209932 RepID=A0A9P7QP36_9PEZI|nr:NAD dependent epimerase/dehydratase [Colletotrichum scovillei]KAF4784556.1 NAD dependent epimerase/dehydratase [Colletotrichum scovillei]KAG7037999.1 NAD dependent epimerase/dehydratase [Colletotrichum scovillei]KAG7040340.1 NAD dependent epimerase/dehydratase [Colletotrichum scovillei]
MGKRIIFTGGSGIAGRWVIQELLREGHEVMNLDIAPLDNPAVHTMRCDVSDAGQVYSALHSQLRLSQPLEKSSVPDAVIHFAGYARPLLAPDSEVFKTNVNSIHNVIEAACKLGVKKIILASSVCVYGVTFAEERRKFISFPIDEEVDCNPTDPYALSKVVGETIARSFANRFGVDIYCFRIGAVIEPEKYAENFSGYINQPESWDVHGWSYIDARDLGQMCHLGIERDGLGWQVFNATNNNITNTEVTTAFLSRISPSTPFTREMGEREAPMSNKKIQALLGFREEHPWTRYIPIIKKTV